MGTLGNGDIHMYDVFFIGLFSSNAFWMKVQTFNMFKYSISWYFASTKHHNTVSCATFDYVQ